MSEVMGIVEILKRVGEKNIRVQHLMECITNVERRKSGTAVTFITDQITPDDVVVDKPKKIGLVIWLPGDLVEKILKERES